MGIIFVEGEEHIGVIAPLINFAAYIYHAYCTRHSAFKNNKIKTLCNMITYVFYQPPNDLLVYHRNLQW
jgi:hypothetical protein